MISAVIVGYRNEPAELRAAIAGLQAQDPPPGEIVVVDNSPDGRYRPVAEEAGARRLVPGSNVGYPRAVNLAVRECRGEQVFLLNPDAVPEPGCLAALAAALDASPEAAIAGAQILLPDGRVNAGDNPIHLGGLSWSGNYLGQPEEGRPRRTLAVSGAAVLVRTRSFRELGGFHPAIFMYFDDADFCWRARLAGQAVLFCPAARVRHRYRFDQGPAKWGWLEASRLASVLTNYQARTLLILAPLLTAVELGALAMAIRDGWLRQKLAAWRSVWQNRRGIAAFRRSVAGRRRVLDRDLLDEFAPVLDTPLIDSGLTKATRPLQRLYGRLALFLLQRR